MNNGLLVALFIKLNSVNATLTDVIQKTLKITLMRLDETREKLLITGINNGPCL